MVNDWTTPVEPDSTTTIYSRRDNNDDSSGSRLLLEAAEGPTEVSPKQRLIDEFVDNLLVRIELEETTAVHMMTVCAFMPWKLALSLRRSTGKFTNAVMIRLVTLFFGPGRSGCAD